MEHPLLRCFSLNFTFGLFKIFTDWSAVLLLIVFCAISSTNKWLLLQRPLCQNKKSRAKSVIKFQNHIFLAWWIKITTMNLRSSFTLSAFLGGSSICRQSFHSMLFFKLVPVWTIPPLLCLLSCCPTHEVETSRIFWQRESDARPRSMAVIQKTTSKQRRCSSEGGCPTAAPSALCSPTTAWRSSWSSLSPRPRKNSGGLWKATRLQQLL